MSSSIKQHIVTAPRDSSNRALNNGIGRRGKNGSVDSSFFRIEKYGNGDEKGKEIDMGKTEDTEGEREEWEGTTAEPYDHPSLDRITCKN